MLKDIIKKGNPGDDHERQVRLHLSACAILILLSVYTGVTTYRPDQREYRRPPSTRRTWKASRTTRRWPGWARRSTSPPGCWGAIASGVDEAVGRVASVNIAYDPNLVDPEVREQPCLFGVRGPRPDLHRQDRPQPVRHPLHLRRHRRREGEGHAEVNRCSNRGAPGQADPGQGDGRFHQPADPADYFFGLGPLYPHPGRSGHFASPATTGPACS